MSDRDVVDVPVLIVGAGPVGLSTAIMLSRGGVASLLIERHPGTSIHPKARGLNVRTMEIVRQWGIEDGVRAAGLPPEEHGFFYRGASLVSERFERTGGGGLATAAQALSPATWMVISQDAFEPVLLEHVRTLGRTDVRFDHELEALTPTGAAVEARVVDRLAGRPVTVRARHVVGADGADSTVREQVGVRLEGQGPLVDNISILFEAALAQHIADRRSAVYFLSDDPAVRPRGYPMSVGNPPPNGVLLTVDNADRWLLVVGTDEGRDPASGVDWERASALVRRAVGLDVPVRIVGTMPWSPAARVADRYRVGNVFVAGDAAHEMTPSGAFGLNVGIQDAHNLGWKLAAHHAGWAGPALLDTYEAERRPAGAFAAEQSHLQFLGTRPPRPFGNWGVILGATYSSAAIVPDGTPPIELDDPAVDYVPQARPGSRAPHAWIRHHGLRASTLDLYGERAVLLAGSEASAWIAAARAAAGAAAIPLDVAQLGASVEPEDRETFERDHGIGDAGAVLVRPDGYVAWRAPGPPGSETSIDRVLARALGRDGG